MSTSHHDRVRAVLGGQIAPAAADGGRRVLYRCDHCGTPWLMDGSRGRYRLAGEELATLAQELAADIGALPYATCRICAAQGIGEINIDAYGAGDIGGYGLSIELTNPTGGHLIGTAVRLDWMEQQARLGRAPRAGVVTDFPRCRAFLSWLSGLAAPVSYRALTVQDSRAMALDNPPGHRAPDTDNWRWCGGAWPAPCAALGGRVLVNLAQAMPEGEVFNMGAMLATWRLLARIIEAGRIAGETGEEG